MGVHARQRVDAGSGLIDLCNVRRCLRYGALRPYRQHDCKTAMKRSKHMRLPNPDGVEPIVVLRLMPVAAVR
jgi:hypothetical protein